MKAEVREHIAENANKLDATRRVVATERAYAFEALSHKRIVEDYDELRKPGTSESQSVTMTFTVGEGLEAGGVVKFDIGLWEACASIGITHGMTESYQSLEHFAAHYMRLLSLYNFSFKRYAQLQSKLQHLPDDPAKCAAARNKIIDEARDRGFVGENDSVLVGTEDQKELAELQALPPIQIRSVKGEAEFEAGPGDEVKGAAAFIGEITFTRSYTRKWFTRLVDYDAFVMENGDVGGELQRLRDVRRNYCALLEKLDRVRHDLALAAFGGGPSDLGDEVELSEKEEELARLSLNPPI